MMATKDAEKPTRRRPPATTPQARENQLIGMAYDEAERQIRNKTASSQVITHFLKLGSEKERLERQKLEAENRLLMARVEQLASSANTEALYKEALDAFRGYRGEDVDEDYYD
jgi:hypothetical protein